MKFITLSNHRSGSSVFQRFLDTHPDIHARQEDLRRITIPVETFVDNIFNSRSARKFKAFGFKVQYPHVRPGLIKHLRFRKAKIIQLIRRDMLETCFWWTGNYRGKTEGGFGVDLTVPAGRKIKANIPKVIRSLKKLNRWIEEYRPIADLTVFYEDDMVGSPPANAETFFNEAKRKEIFNFLGVKDTDKVYFPQSKAKRKPLKRLVSNYDEMMKEIKKQKIKYYYE